MSRIGRLPIIVPAGVDVTLDGRVITVKGPRGVLTRELPPRIEVSREGESLVVTRPTENKLDKSLHGLTRTLVNNMVIGVTTGYRKGLEIIGVGYRAQKVGDKLQLALGHSHPHAHGFADRVTGHHQTQHLVDRVPKVPCQILPRLFIAAVAPALMHQLLNEGLHVIGKIGPGFGPTVLRVAGKMHQRWYPAEYVARRVTVFMQPGDVALNRFAEP
jgi:ribosomal protein L6P/L9E